MGSNENYRGPTFEPNAPNVVQIMSPFFDQTEILGGKATVYRREEGGAFFIGGIGFPLRKKRISKSPKTMTPAQPSNWGRNERLTP